MALLPKRQVMLLSAVATARSMAVQFGGRAAAGTMSISSAASMQNDRSPIRRPGPADRGCAFVASTLRRNALSSHCSIDLHWKYHWSTGFNGRKNSRTRRFFSSSNDDGDNDVSTSCPNKTGDRNGLIRHQILAEDGHPLRLYSRAPRDSAGAAGALLDAAGDGDQKHQRSILLLHGRTWSSQPVFDLRTSDDDEKRQSTLQSLADLGFQAYAMDLRGFGETPRDYRHPESGYTTPRRCVADVKCAIDWITERHASDDVDVPGVESPSVINYRPALLGWSQGALVAQLYAQAHGPATLSDLILFGSIYDPKTVYPRKPLYDPSGKMISGTPDVVKPPPPDVLNTDIDSLEDFTLPGTICDEAALCYSKLAMAVDPVKAAWDDLHEFNAINPALVHVPTMVVVGAQDPYTTWDAQRELFERLGTEDRAMCVMPGCDHAAHILKARKMFVRAVAGFLLRKDEF